MMKVVPESRRVRLSRSSSLEQEARKHGLRQRTRKHPLEAEVMIAGRTDDEHRSAAEISPVLQEGEVLTLLG